MGVQPVRDAYSSMSERYIGLCASVLQEHAATIALVRRSLTGLIGPVLDLGCGPGHWTGDLHSLGADITGIDVVPEFSAFDHAVMGAYRWPADVFAEHLAEAVFTEVERLQYQLADRPDRRYAAIAAKASS